jgi:hypothetical protein
VCALESTDAAVGLSRGHIIVSRVTIVDGESGVGKDNIQVVYMYNRLTVKGVWKVFRRREIHNYLQCT